ncbi:MAG: hypothetical protein P4L50_24620 [Anaerolineaceae bacterium]|nr:hypothetical protein [Anaerolineaceae bacterium]
MSDQTEIKTEVVSNMTRRQIVDQALIDIFKNYPIDYLESIPFDAHGVAIRWLKDHNVPDEVIYLLDTAYIWEKWNIPQLKAGTFTNDVVIADMDSELPRVLNWMSKLGYTFQYSYEGEKLEGSSIEWEPPKSEA